MQSVLKNFDKLLECLPNEGTVNYRRLAGVCIEAKDGIVRFIAADGHRMMILDYPDEVLLPKTVTIPEREYMIPSNSARILYMLSRKRGFNIEYMPPEVGVMIFPRLRVTTNFNDAIEIQLNSDEPYPDYRLSLNEGSAAALRKDQEPMHLSFDSALFGVVLGGHSTGAVTLQIPKDYDTDGECVLSMTSVQLENGIFIAAPLRMVAFGVSPEVGKIDDIKTGE